MSCVNLCSFLLTYILSFLLEEVLVFMLLNSGWLPMLLLYFWLIHSYLKLLTEAMNYSSLFRAPLVAQTVKNLPAMQETWVWSLDWEDPLEKGMETLSNVLAWRISWTEEPDGPHSMASQSVRHNSEPHTLSLSLLVPCNLHTYFHIHLSIILHVNHIPSFSNPEKLSNLWGCDSNSSQIKKTEFFNVSALSAKIIFLLLCAS